MKAFLFLFFSIFLLHSCQYDTGKTSAQSPNNPTICTSCPIIEENQDTLEFVRKVQKFVGEKANMGYVYNALCDTFHKIQIDEFPVDTYLRIFEENKGTASCGLTSMIMVKILLENGIDAYTYNFGFEKTRITHVIVLVKNKGRLLIFDPHIGYELKDDKGKGIDLISLIKNVGQNNKTFKPYYDSYTVESKLLIDFSALNELKLERYGDSCAYYFDQMKENKEIVTLKTKRCFHCNKVEFCKGFVQQFEEILKKKTNFSKFYEGYVFKLNYAYGADDYSIIDNNIDSILMSENL